MLIPFTCLALLLSLTADAKTPDDPPRSGSRTSTCADLKPVTVAVVDFETGKPVTDFSYLVGFWAPGGTSPMKEDWQHVESASGTLMVQAPPACLLLIRVKSNDILAGSTQFHEFVIRSTDNPRRGLVKLQRAQLFTGPFGISRPGNRSPGQS